MQRYDTYKDSGVKWLGEIPGHWEVKRLASYFTERRVKVSDKEYEPLSVTKLGVFPQWENVAKTNDGDNRKLVKKGDFVINSRSDRKGSSGVADRDGSVSLINIVLKPRNTIRADFSNYLLKSYKFIEEYYRNGRGIVADLWTTRYDEMKMIKLAVPPLEEQTAIAAYLDTATAKIDAAIAQQQKMIDLLNERKQIIINRAVTKGLNPNAKMKDSGVEWIGEVPEGWECRRLRFIGEANNGLTYSPSDMVDEGNGILVLRSSNIKDGKLVFEDNVFVKEVPQKLMVQKDDIIICSRNGSASLVGKCAIVEEELHASFGAFMMRFRSEHNSKYVYYLLTTAISHYKQLFATSTINQLTLGIFADIRMPITLNEDEQKCIAKTLDLICGKLDAYIEKCNNQISLLQERKQIVINEVVTGKVKVI